MWWHFLNRSQNDQLANELLWATFHTKSLCSSAICLPAKQTKQFVSLFWRRKRKKERKKKMKQRNRQDRLTHYHSFSGSFAWEALNSCSVSPVHRTIVSRSASQASASLVCIQIHQNIYFSCILISVEFGSINCFSLCQLLCVTGPLKFKPYNRSLLNSD